jgi:hypothetical protein
LLTLRLLQLASLICASCDDGLKFIALPNGPIIVETARFNLLGVLLKVKARPTFIFVREANLEQIQPELTTPRSHTLTVHFEVTTHKLHSINLCVPHSFCSYGYSHHKSVVWSNSL